MRIPIFPRRIKLFSRRTPIPPQISELFKPQPEIEKKFPLKIIVEPSKNKWSNDISKLSVTDKKRVDKLKKDIREGHLFDNNGDPDSDTHYLSDFSKTVGPNKSLLMSKYINHSDRLNYRVYPPKLVEDEKTGKTEYVQKVVLESCRGHSRNGAKNYSDTTNGNTRYV